MIRLFKVVTILILHFGSVNVFAQDKEKIAILEHLRIEKRTLSAILDSVVAQEKKCLYYDSKLLFSIHIKENEGRVLLSIGSLMDINLLLSSSSYGYFYHRDHLFIVEGDKNDDIFSIGKRKRNFKYLDYSHPDFQPKKGEKTILYHFNDDSFSQWYYWYVNSDFVLEAKSTFCD